MSVDELTKTTRVQASLGIEDAKSVLRDIGRSLKRVQSPPAAGGLQVVSHQGKLRTALTSWHRASQDVARQELSFFGHVVEYRKGTRLCTGTAIEGAEGEGGDKTFTPHREPDLQTLEAASVILRECEKRDYFTQHLLKEVTALIQQLHDTSIRTQVSGLDVFKNLEQAMRDDGAVVQEAEKGDVRMIVVSIVVVCLAIALGLFWFLWRHH